MSTLLGIALISGMIVCAQGKVGEAEEKALQDTQNILRNPSERQKALKDNPKGQQADKMLKDLAGTPENAQLMYDLAADILTTLVQETGGDPEKMEEILQNALTNPAALAKRFSPEQLKKLREIASKIEARKGKNP